MKSPNSPKGGSQNWREHLSQESDNPEMEGCPYDESQNDYEQYLDDCQYAEHYMYGWDDDEA